jgi:hypothetical protein
MDLSFEQEQLLLMELKSLKDDGIEGLFLDDDISGDVFEFQNVSNVPHAAGRLIPDDQQHLLVSSSAPAPAGPAASSEPPNSSSSLSSPPSSSIMEELMSNCSISCRLVQHHMLPHPNHGPALCSKDEASSSTNDDDLVVHDQSEDLVSPPFSSSSSKVPTMLPFSLEPIDPFTLKPIHPAMDDTTPSHFSRQGAERHFMDTESAPVTSTTPFTDSVIPLKTAAAEPSFSSSLETTTSKQGKTASSSAAPKNKKKQAKRNPKGLTANSFSDKSYTSSGLIRRELRVTRSLPDNIDHMIARGGAGARRRLAPAGAGKRNADFHTTNNTTTTKPRPIKRSKSGDDDILKLLGVM